MKNMSISVDDVTVYRKDGTSQSGKAYTRYSTKISKKKDDGNWIDQFIGLTFKGGADIAHKAVINIKKAFATLNEYQGTITRDWVVMEYEVVGGTQTNVDPNGFMNIPEGVDEELPFC